MDIIRMDSLNQKALPPFMGLATDERDDAPAVAPLDAALLPLVSARIARSLASARRRVPSRQKVPLARAIAQQVVPLLLLAHSDDARAKACAWPDFGAARFPGAIVALADLALTSDVSGALRLVEDLQAEGHALETLYLEVISGAARHLGQLWHDDRASFADVTIGILALQRLLHGLDHAFCCNAGPARPDPARRLLLSTCPGEAHAFSLDVVGAFLRRAGWVVDCIAPRCAADLSAAANDGWYAVLGLSDSCGDRPEELACSIHVAKRASLNRQLRVMVGGPAVVLDPERAMRAGADATATDARHAVVQAEGLLALVRKDACRDPQGRLP